MSATHMVGTETKRYVEKTTKIKWLWQNVNNGWVNLGKDDYVQKCIALSCNFPARGLNFPLQNKKVKRKKEGSK